ncbi:MAG TPA: sulfurtransferase [Gemmatimonadales bacterium]|jgi:thiosulfate/3-mercaptopyruvate sulfurtransferase|nr:sulfurtransferase [Gemmatimonadales bacterium]
MFPLLLAILTATPRLAAPASGDQPLVVSTAWLADHLHDKGLVIFQIGDRASRPSYDAGHIPGAQFLSPGTEFSTPRVEGALALELPPVAVLDSVLEARGVSDDSRIVLYAAQQYFSPTARALFTLEYLGLRGRVSILDGGLEAWKAEGRGLSTAEPQPIRGSFTPHPRSELVVDAGFVNEHLADRAIRIVDARDTSFYNGRDTRQGRNGHIPGAVSIPFSTIVDSSGKFREPVQLRAQFAEAGVRDGQTVVTYCHIGQQASLVWFAARLLGFNAKLYDGSFQDWAGRKELPVEGGRPE